MLSGQSGNGMVIIERDRISTRLLIRSTLTVNKSVAPAETTKIRYDGLRYLL